ncbi:MAG TPA: cyanophycin synthetase [Thermomicrobiales bacterium]|nr:cyanophycin synthetase [Thermomicrobiales bacterium]
MAQSTAMRTTPSALARYHEAVARTDALIERANTPEGKSPREIRDRAVLRMERVRRFLDLLGNPHRGYPIVHVGGTSGKGSTSTAIAAILTAAGYRTGLHTSPYLQAASEKLQIDGRLIGPDDFADLVDTAMRAHERWQAAGGERLTYGEIWIALLALSFTRERVDVAVIEVGAGGRFDLTNVVQPTVSVVTTVGLDHTVTLGGTIPEIAWHKAGIIKAGAPAVTAVSDASALKIIQAEANRAGVPLIHVAAGETFETLPPAGGRTRWRERRRGAEPGPVLTAPPGGYQSVNAATAVAAIRALPSDILRVPEDAIARGLATTRIPGRFETVQEHPRVILDGAHNPEKVAALVTDLSARSDLTGKRLIVVVGVVEAKQHAEMVGLLVPYADSLVVTLAKVLAKPGTDASVLADEARAAGFTGPLAVESDAKAALDVALRWAEHAPESVILVTGSLYLVGNVRSRWYPDDAIVLQRTPWPTG